MSNSKQRVLDAIKHNKYDKIPIDFWSTPETDSKLLRHFGFDERSQLLDKFNVDIVYIDGSRYIGRPLKHFDDDSSEDIWGLRRKTVSIGKDQNQQSYSELVKSPLIDVKSVDDIIGYDLWPNPNDYDYSGIKAQCTKVGDKAVFFMGDRMNRIAQFKPAQYLRGMEQLLVDCAINPDIFFAIISKVKEFYCQYLKNILESANGMIL